MHTACTRDEQLQPDRVRQESCTAVSDGAEGAASCLEYPGLEGFEAGFLQIEARPCRRGQTFAYMLYACACGSSSVHA